jgi:hypothetical protein
MAGAKTGSAAATYPKPTVATAPVFKKLRRSVPVLFNSDSASLIKFLSTAFSF